MSLTANLYPSLSNKDKVYALNIDCYCWTREQSDGLSGKAMRIRHM